MRYREPGSIHDVSGMSAFFKDENLDFKYLLAVMNSVVGNYVLKMLNPTINLQVGNLSKFPVIVTEEAKKKIDGLASDCINITRSYWNCFETSWNFQSQYLLQHIAEHQKSPPAKFLTLVEFCDKYVPIQFRRLIFYGKLSKTR